VEAEELKDMWWRYLVVEYMVVVEDSTEDFTDWIGFRCERYRREGYQGGERRDVEGYPGEERRNAQSKAWVVEKERDKKLEMDSTVTLGVDLGIA
jgi:hypothetical protein